MANQHCLYIIAAFLGASVLGCVGFGGNTQDLYAPVVVQNPMSSDDGVLLASDGMPWSNQDASLVCTQNSVDKTRFVLSFSEEKVCSSVKSYEFIQKNKVESSIASFANVRLIGDETNVLVIPQALESAREVGQCTFPDMRVVSIVELNATGCVENQGAITDKTQSLRFEVADDKGHRKIKEWGFSN